jgi:hypothetical protein
MGMAADQELFQVFDKDGGFFHDGCFGVRYKFTTEGVLCCKVFTVCECLTICQLLIR